MSEGMAGPTCDDALAAGVVGDELAEVVAGDGQRARLAPGFQQLHKHAQDLEVLLLKVPHILAPELLLRQTGSKVGASSSHGCWSCHWPAAQGAKHEPSQMSHAVWDATFQCNPPKKRLIARSLQALVHNQPIVSKQLSMLRRRAVWASDRTEVCMGVQSRLPDRTSFRYTSKDDSSAMCCRSSSSNHVSSSGMSGSSQFCAQSRRGHGEG